ncbi:MAG: SpoIIE family protein phosphatase [Bryobacteraceae bacterium]
MTRRHIGDLARESAWSSHRNIHLCARLTGVKPDSIPRQVVAVALLRGLPFFGIACVVLLVGICLIVFARRRSRDTTLLWVGVFSVLYAVRLFVGNDLVHTALNLPAGAFAPWGLLLTYIIPIPYGLFARELFGRGWKGTIAIWLWAEVVFSVIAIPAALLAHRFNLTGGINSALIIAGTLLVLLHVFLREGDADSVANSLKWPLIIFGVFVILTNRGYRPYGIDIEPVGFLVLLTGLGSAAARRTLMTERKLRDVEQELAAARRIQDSIIPRSLPHVYLLRLATRYEPMTSVAGDFNDFLQTGDTRLTILVADVSGHGVPAALVASMLKVCFAAQREQAPDPAAVLAGLNVMLYGSLGGQYVTAACAAIDRGATKCRDGFQSNDFCRIFASRHVPSERTSCSASSPLPLSPWALALTPPSSVL